MSKAKIRVYDEQYNEMFYIEDLFFFEQQNIHSLEDFSDGVTVMLNSECCDHGGSEVWEGDTMSNGYSTIEIEYDNSKASYIGRFTHNKDEWRFLYELIEHGFLRVGNKYCIEH